MNLTSAARGLTAGLATPDSAGVEALQQAHRRRAVERLGDDDPAQQVEDPAGERRHAEAAAALDSVSLGDLLGDLVLLDWASSSGSL